MSTIVTGEAVTLELPVARLGSRLLAKAIDTLIQVVAMYVLLIVLVQAAGGLDLASLLAVLFVVVVVVFIGYPVGMETLARGRTVGKIALGLRVVRDDGGPIVFRQALVRGLGGLFLDKPGLGTLGTGLPLTVFTSAARDDAKSLSDVLAGTIVISERIPGGLAPPPPMPPFLVAWAQKADLSGIDDRDALQARQLVGRLASFTPASREQIGADMVRALLGPVTPPPPPGTAPFDAVCAVLAERRRRDLDRLLAQQRRAAAGHSGVALYDRV